MANDVVLLSVTRESHSALTQYTMLELHDVFSFCDLVEKSVRYF
jgi:hypothetical protein